MSGSRPGRRAASLQSGRLVLALIAIATAAWAQGWVGQRRISLPDSTTDQVANIAMDSAGSPWVSWNGRRGDSSPMYTRWLGDRFDPERPAALTDTGVADRPCANLAFDRSTGRMWISWDEHRNNNNNNTVLTSRWQDSLWGSPIPVTTDDTLHWITGSAIACGGSAVWCIWEIRRDDISDTSTIFASRWDEEGHAWAPRMQVSQPDGGLYWWCKAAADGQGRPHVFWCDPRRLRLWYSFYDGAHWSAPVPVNDTERTTASPFADPHISIDLDGILHVVYTGALIGSSYRNIMYTWNDGTGWRPSVRATKSSRDSLYPPWYGAIAAIQHDDIWAVWDRQGEGSDQFRVHASHFDGNEWSSEERLDDDSAYCDGCPEIALDNQGQPWVVWDGIDPATRHFTIYYNRRAQAGIAGPPVRPSSDRLLQLRVKACSPGAVELEYGVPTPSQFNVAIFDKLGRRVALLANGLGARGVHIVCWDGRASDGRLLASGIYFCHLNADVQSLSAKFSLTRK